MLIDRKHTPWSVATVLIALAAGAVYFWDAPHHPSGPGGSTVVGLTLGIAALALMLFLVGLGLKRRVPHWRVGSAQAWLRGHIWMGLLVPWLVALHGAFAAGGPMTTIMWVLLAIVTVSGLYGLILQQFLPSLLLHAVPSETIAQQIQRELDGLVTLAEGRVSEHGKVQMPGVVLNYVGVELNRPAPAYAAGAEAPALTGDEVADLIKSGQPVPGSEPLRRLYVDRVKPFLAGAAGSPLASSTRAEAMFDAVRIATPAHVHPGVDALAGLCLRRRQLQRQRVLMSLLMNWLYIHVPLAWTLLLMAAAHAITALRY